MHNNSIKLLFEHDELAQNNEQLKQFVKTESRPFVTTIMDDAFVAIIKSVPKEKQTSEKVRMIAGALSRECSLKKIQEAQMDANLLLQAFSELPADQVITAMAEGWDLGSYSFTAYKSKKAHEAAKLHLYGRDDLDASIETGKLRAAATAFARNLVNEIPSVMNPETFPDILKDAFQDSHVKVTVYDKNELEKMQMNGVLTVGRGSKYDPSFVELSYRKDESKPLIALVGKGVTYDTGGISLKRGRDLSDMRMDMGGAAAVAGAMKLLASLQADVNVVALIPIVENMPDRLSVLPGDIIRYKNGHTVQVGNTDAEGRLILADGLIRAGELNAEVVIDIATLTGAIWNALGSKLAGVFGDEKLAFQMKEIGAENGDFNWPMPLVDAYENDLKSDYADFSNISSKGEAGSITAGLFLRRFVPESCKWLHVDMAGVMSSKEEGYYTNAATGYGARLLADFTVHLSR